MTDLTTEYLSDLDLESLPVGTTIECTKGADRSYGVTGGVVYEIQKAPSKPTEDDIKEFDKRWANLKNGKLT